MYKIQDLISKGLQVDKLPADIQDDIETLKLITSEFTQEDADGHEYDDAIFDTIMSGYQNLMPKTAPELENEPEPEPEPAQVGDNVLIGDRYFSDHPDKVLGKQSSGGRYGTAIVVTGDKNKLNIDVPAVPKIFIKFSGNSAAATETKEKIIAEVEKVIEKHKQSHKKKKKEAKTIISAEMAAEPEYYTFREISDFYNSKISRQEMEAYMYANPILPFEKYIGDHQYTIEQLVESGHLFYENDKFIYLYQYVAGDINRRMTYLKRDAALIREKFGDASFEKQLNILRDAMPVQAQINIDTEDSNRIVLSCISEFAKTVKIKLVEISFYDEQQKQNYSDLENTLNYFFDQYIDFIHAKESILFKGSNKVHVHRYNQGIKVGTRPEQGKNVDKDEAARNKKDNLNDWQKAKTIAEKLFNKFLFEELFSEAKMKIEILWNEKFNAYKTPNLNKIPVGFSISKFIKNTHLKLNITQRESVAFINYNRCGCLALEVGLGKTIAALASISQAVENNLAKKPLIIVPKNVFLTWKREIEGEKIEEGKEPNVGVLHHYPKVIMMGNCNTKSVFSNKTYTDEELNDVEKSQKQVDLAREQNRYIKKHNMIPDSMFVTAENPMADLARQAMATVEYDISVAVEKLEKKYELQLQRAYYNQSLYAQLRAMLDEKIRKIIDSKIDKFMRYYLKVAKQQYEYCVYMTGTYRNSEPGTITLCTTEALQNGKIGCRDSELIAERMFTILSGGQPKGGATESEDEGEQEQEDEGEGMSSIEEAKLYQTIKSRVEARLGNAKLALEDMGIDMVIIDEAHKAKKIFASLVGQVERDSEGNIRQVIKRNKKTGKPKRDSDGNQVMEADTEKLPYSLGSGSTSGTAMSAFILSTYIQETTKTGNVILLTATPFENDPLEIYSMLTLANYPKLVELGYKSMKKFFETYMRIENDYKVKLNGVEKALILNGFQNLIQFRNIVRSIVLHRTGEQAEIDRPDKIIIPYQNRGLLPDSVTEIKAMLLPTAEQDTLIKKIESFVAGEITLTQLQMDESEKYMIEQSLKEQEELEKEAEKDEKSSDEDEESYEPDETGEKPKKKTRKKSDEEDEDKKAPPVINVSLQTESEQRGTRIIQAFNLIRQVTLSPYALKLIKDSNIQRTITPAQLMDSSPKLQYIIACIKSVKLHHEKNGSDISGQIIYSTVAKDFFPLIREYLINPKYGIGYEDSQVQIVSGDTSDAKKEKYKTDFYTGEIKVLIASKTIQVGANLMKNATVMYHLFYDWNPTDNEQINGRIWRQGNRYGSVRIVYPMVENSVDPVVFQYLGEKTMRIKDVWDVSGVKSQLDLSEFDPTKMKLAALTDPYKKAKFQIQIEKEELEDEIRYLYEKREVVKNIPSTIRNFYQYTEKAVNYLNTFFTALKNYRLSELADKRSEDIEGLVSEKSELSKPIDDLIDLRDTDVADLKIKIGNNQQKIADLDELLKAEQADVKAMIGEAAVSGDDDLLKKLQAQYKNLDKTFKKDKEKELKAAISELEKAITALVAKYQKKIDPLQKKVAEKLAAIEKRITKVEADYTKNVQDVSTEIDDKINKINSKALFPSLKEYLTFMSYQSTYVIKWCRESDSEGRRSKQMEEILYRESYYRGDLENFKNYKGQYEKIKLTYLDPMGIAEEDAENIPNEITKEIRIKEADLENIENKFVELLDQFTRDYNERVKNAKTPEQTAGDFAMLNFLLDELEDNLFIEEEPEQVPEVIEPGKEPAKVSGKPNKAEYIRTKIEMFEMALETANEKMKARLETKIEMFKEALAGIEENATLQVAAIEMFAKGGRVGTRSSNVSSYVDLVTEALMTKKQFVKFMRTKGIYILPNDVFTQIENITNYDEMIETMHFNDII
jgi:hypothetical protein